MKNLPAVCTTCGIIFPSGIIVGDVRGLTLKDNFVGPCPVGHPGGKVIEGTFDVVSGILRVLSGPSITHEILRKLEGVVKNGATENPSDFAASLSDVPVVGKSLAGLVPEDPVLLTAYLAILLQLIQIWISINTPQPLSEDQIARSVAKGLQQYEQQLADERPQTESIGRNQPCPCESGKKYKHCCGRHNLSPSDRLLRDIQEGRQNPNHGRSGYRT